VIVLKSPRGICLQLESGKVIAIRASMKPGQLPGDLKAPGLPGFTDSATIKNDASVALGLPVTASGSDDVIDMTNSDDEEASVSKILDRKASMQSIINGNGNGNSNTVSANISDLNEPQIVGGSNSSVDSSSDEVSFKEKPIFKPNLVQRKPKMLPPSSTDPLISTLATSTVTTTTSSSMYSNDRNRTNSSTTPYGSSSNYPHQKPNWNRYQNSSSSSSSGSSNYYRDMNGGAKSDPSVPYPNRKLESFISFLILTANCPHII
jgi:hypothetical protein